MSAPKRDEIVDRGILGDELVVQAAVDHYENAVPWERMERQARQQDGHIFEKAVSSQYFGLDATSMPVLDIAHPFGIRTSTLWPLQGDRVYSYFMYAESGHAHHLEQRLKGYKLASVMCDGSATNNCVERAGGDSGCSADMSRARSAADALTIIMTCKNLRIDPRRYMRDTLRRILDGEKDLQALLPENYKPRPVAERSSASCSESVARTHTVPSRCRGCRYGSSPRLRVTAKNSATE